MTHNAIFQRINQSFSRSGVLSLLGFQLARADKGVVEVVLPYSSKVANQQELFHGGMISTLSDTSAGYASLTVAPEGMEVATVEFKINFLSNHKGGELRAVGKVLKGGRRLIVTSSEIFHVDDAGKSTLCAIAQQTMMAIPKTY